MFGGGVAGLTAAHELAERGFDVTVYERRAWGGKARSTEVPDSATGGRKPLPGEHGFRGEFGCYQNLTDTMRRIPFGANEHGVFDNMVGLRQSTFLRTREHDLALPILSLDPRPYTPQEIVDLVLGLLVDLEIPPDAAAHFVARFVVFLSSCDARRLGQWERMAWTDFIATDRYPIGYYKTLGTLPEYTQASKAADTSAKYVAWLFEAWIIYPLLGFGTNGPVLRMLNAPTNEAWIDPWLTELSRLGVKLRLGRTLTGWKMRQGAVAGATIRTPRGRHETVVADAYVCALPVERARGLWNPAMLAADPKLADMQNLRTGWLNGINYYLRDRPSMPGDGIALADSPFVMTGVRQAQLWNVDIPARYGDGTVREKLSISVADFDAPGVRFGKKGRDCTRDELALDAWEQIKQHVNDPGRPPVLTDAMLHSYDVDPGLYERKGRLVSQDPLILPTAGTERHRPDTVTGIPNLVLAGDYLSGVWEVASMEAASFGGRRAANAVLQQQGSPETPASTIGPYRPPEWEPFKRIDAKRYAEGRRNLFDLDTDLSPEHLIEMLGSLL